MPQSLRLAPGFQIKRWAIPAVILLGFAPTSIAQTPLHQRIDQLIAAKPESAKLTAPRASDEEFLRRVCLDLTGTIPPASEARAFLNDDAPDKRRQLIDRLLASPEHVRHMQQVFDVLLLDRRPGKNVTEAQWQEFLRDSFAANKPWDRLVREILSADGSDPKTRAAARFVLDRDGEPHVLTKDISRLFLGKTYDCNQCHDSPVVDEYKQADYYGLFAFLSRGFLFTGKDKQVVYAEKAEGESTFQNVFDATKTTRNTGPRLPGGTSVQEPSFEKGKEYTVPPDKGERPVPKFSRRAQLAPLLASRDNSQFKRAGANRFWTLLLGRGLVHPVEMDHEGNSPSHPELLDLLAEEFARGGFDTRAFLRELALSETYQRASQPPPGVNEIPSELFAVAPLKPLSPEQLAWSTMQATGLIDAERQAQGKNPNAQTLFAKLAGNVAPFATVYGGPRGQPEGQAFQATMDQALFLSNGALVRGWLKPRPGNLTDRLQRLNGPAALAEELYLSVLTRRPSDEESKEVADHLTKRGADRSAALQELVWALIASAEFRFNH